MAPKSKGNSTSRRIQNSMVRKTKPTSKKKQQDKQTTTSSSLSRQQQQKESNRGARQLVEKKTASDKKVVVRQKNTIRWKTLSHRTRSFICSALDEAAISVESTCSGSKLQQVSRLLATVKKSVTEELAIVKAPSFMTTVKNYHQVSDLNTSLSEVTRAEEQRKNELLVAGEKLEEVIEQSEDQLNEITRSGMKELHTAASQVKLTLQSEMQASTGLGLDTPGIRSSVENRLINSLSGIF